MAGTPAERALLGYVLHKPDRRLALEEVRGDDFSDPSMGAIWDGIASDLIGGREVDVVTLELRFPEWGVAASFAAEVWQWHEEGFRVVVPDRAVEVVTRDASARYASRRLQEALAATKSGEEHPDQVLADLVREIADRRLGDQKEEFESYTLGQMLDMSFRDEFVIPGLLERKDRLIITGTEGGGKTTIGRQILIYAAAGLHPFEHYGDTPTPLPNGPVRSLVIDAENTVKQWARNSAWIVRKVSRYVKEGGEYTDMPNENMTIVPTGRLDILRPEHLGMIHRKIDQERPDIVFVGPLYRISRGGMLTEEDAMKVIAALDTIRDRGVALIMEAHSGHAREGDRRSVRPRGSSALLGWPEFGMGIRQHMESNVNGPPTPVDGVYELAPWRGAREADRQWPTLLRRGESHDPYPFMPIED